MADTKISALTNISDQSGVEDLPLNDAGTTKRVLGGRISPGDSIELTAAYTLASQTAAQKAFNSPSNGAFNAKANTTYLFEVFISLTSMSGTSGSFGFAFLGTATLTRQAWQTSARKGALATAGTDESTFNTAANTAIVTASTSTTGQMRVRGILRVGTGGTIIPAVSLGVAAAAIVGNDSFAIFKAIGADTVQSVGNWS